VWTTARLSFSDIKDNPDSRFGLSPVCRQEIGYLVYLADEEGVNDTVSSERGAERTNGQIRQKGASFSVCRKTLQPCTYPAFRPLMLYHEKEDLGLIFDLVEKHYARKEEVPDYKHEQAGVDKLLGVFEGVKSAFYPSLEEKASYLILQINKGHFFSNGNKRLALVAAMGFLVINDKILSELSKEKYRAMLEALFPLYNAYEDQADFSPDEYALYNLSIIIADSHRYIEGGANDYDGLKSKVVDFFRQSLIDWKERVS